MSSRRGASKREQPAPPPVPSPPPPDLLLSVMTNPLILDAIFVALTTIQDRVSLASTCTTLYAHAYALGPGSGGGGSGSGVACLRLWPNIEFYSSRSYLKLGNMLSWLKEPRRCRGVEGCVAHHVLRVCLFGYNAIPLHLARPVRNECRSLISAHLVLPPSWVQQGFNGADLPATLRHLFLLLEESGFAGPRYRPFNLAHLTALTSLRTGGTQLVALPASLRRLRCRMWSATATSASAVFEEPDALELFDVDYYDIDNCVWVVGGGAPGVASGDKLARFLRRTVDLSISCMALLSHEFFSVLSPSLRSLHLGYLNNGPGLVTEGLARLRARVPGLRSLHLGFCDEYEGIPRAAIELLGDACKWTTADRLEAALAALAFTQLESLGLGDLMNGKRSGQMLSLEGAQCDGFRGRFAAAPVLPNVRSLDITEVGLFVAEELFLDKLPNLECLYLIENSYFDHYELGWLLAAVISKLPKLTTLYADECFRHGVAEDPISYVFGMSPGTPNWEAASPKARAEVEAVLARGFQIKPYSDTWRYRDSGFPKWDAVEVGQHGPEAPCRYYVPAHNSGMHRRRT